MTEEKNKENKNIKDAEIIDNNKNSNKLIFILSPLLLIIGITSGIFLGPLLKSMFGGDHDKETTLSANETKNRSTEQEESHNAEESATKKHPVDPSHIAFIPVPDVLVNLKTEKKARPIFLKVSIVLEVHDPKIKDAIEALKPKVVDQMQLFLRDLDIGDVTGANNLQRLRRELHMRVNNVISPHKVEDVLIKEFLIQ